MGGLKLIAALTGLLFLPFPCCTAGKDEAAAVSLPLKSARLFPQPWGGEFTISADVVFLNAKAKATFVLCVMDELHYLECVAGASGIATSRVHEGKRQWPLLAPIRNVETNRKYRVKVGASVSPAVLRHEEEAPTWVVGRTWNIVSFKAKMWRADQQEPGWQVAIGTPGMPVAKGNGEKIGYVPNEGVSYANWRLEPLHVVKDPDDVAPSKIIEVPQGREAQWLAIGDLDNDGDLDFLTARNINQVVTALTAYDRDGNVLWQWGEGGSPTITYDVPAQIYDIDGDGESEVLYSIAGFFVVANGANGAEEKRWPLPEGLKVADCIVIANSSGKKRPSDLLIKTRYDHLWAYDNNFSLLWEWSGNTGHHPCPDDVDGDGKDELFCGYTLLDDNGREIWRLTPEPPGHADTARIYWNLDGKSPDVPWYLTTCCGGKDLILTDHLNKRLWQMRPNIVLHFQSARAAELRLDLPGKEFVVDIAGNPAPPLDDLVVLDLEGDTLGRYTPDYTRFHDVIDWDGNGVMEIIIPRADGIFDGKGQQLVRFLDPPPHPKDRETPFCYVADIYNDGNDDVILLDDSSLRIYSNAKLPPRKPNPLVMKRYYNYTFY